MDRIAKAVIFTGPGKVEIGNIKLPELEEDEILFKTEFSGISVGTDGWILKGIFADTKFPLVPGYQRVGIVEKVGSRVKKVKVGDRVYSHYPSRFHPEEKVHPMWGAHSSYSVVKENLTFPLPDTVNPEEMSLLTLPSVSLHGIEMVTIFPGDLVVVIGQGIIGQMSAQIARIFGAKVIALEILPKRLELSKIYSADFAINPEKEDVKQLIQKIKPEGADVVIETTGKSELLDFCINLLKTGGKLVLQGYYPASLTFDSLLLHLKQITIFNPCDDGGEECEKKVLKLIEEGKVKLYPLITHLIDYQKSPEMFKLMIEKPGEVLGVVIDWRTS